MVRNKIRDRWWMGLALVCVLLGIQGVLAQPAAAGNIMISAGTGHTCALNVVGSVYCWGATATGTSSTTGSDVPQQVQGLASGVVQISSGGSHTCAVTQAGAALCWGSNINGELGNGGAGSQSYTPVPVTGLDSGVTQISAGYDFTCAVMATQTVKCWGSNFYGQLGDGTQTDHYVPADVAGLTLASGVTIRNLATDHLSACLVTSANDVWCWGRIGSILLPGQLTNPVAATRLITGVAEISMGWNGLCTLDGRGAINCYSDQGQIATPTLPAGVVVYDLEGGADAFHTCILSSTGAPYCWGSNIKGELGNLTYTDSPTVPVQPAVLTSGIVRITAGYEHTCVVASNGYVYCWGDSSTGQVGAGRKLVKYNGETPVLGVNGAGFLNLLRPTHPVSNDFNGDGITDLLWKNTDGSASVWLAPNGLAKNGEAGPTTTNITNFGPYPGWSPFSGDSDFDGDGQSDLLWTNVNGAVAIWLMDCGCTQLSPQTSFGPTSQVTFGPYPGWALVSGNADFNGDGRSDLLWWNSSTGQAAIWLMNGTTVLSTATYGPYPGWTVLSGNNDFNGDGLSDLLWTNANGAAAVWLMNGTTATTTAAFGPYAGWTALSGDADYNGDGKTDLLWTNTDGSTSIWFMDGAASFAVSTYPAIPGWSILPGRRDFNADGRNDLLWLNNTTKQVSAWFMNGLLQYAHQEYGPYDGWTIDLSNSGKLTAASGDYSASGNTGLLWTNTNTGVVSQWVVSRTGAITVNQFGPFSGWSVLSGLAGP